MSKSTVVAQNGLNETHYAAVLNFFYFLLLDEGLALSASYKTVRNIQKHLKQDSASTVESVIIGTMSHVLRKYKSRKKHHAVQPPRSEWLCPSAEFLGAWKEFMRHGDLDSSEALVLHLILNYPVKAISQALDIPEGTVYFRLGRGLEAFAKGSYFQSGVTR